MKTLLFVALGGSLGASGRYLLGVASTKVLGSGFPWGTFIANVLGGFTTFSAFSLEAWRMVETKAFGQLWLYVGLSVLLAIAAVGIGLIVGRKVFA